MKENLSIIKTIRKTGVKNEKKIKKEFIIFF